MKRLIFILSLVTVLPLSTAWAQLQAPNDAGVAMGHLHLLVKDVERTRSSGLRWGERPSSLGWVKH
jgi:hypothetical protein